MKRTTKTSQHPVLRTALAAAIACPVALLGALALPPEQARAASFEKNLGSNQTFEHIAHQNCDDVYTYKAPKRGYVRFKIRVTKVTEENASLKYSILKDGLDYLSSYACISDGTEITERIPVDKGTRLVLTVRPDRQDDEVDYEITAEPLMPDGLEIEPNDTIKQAETMFPNKPRCGLLDKYEERDFYKHKADKDGLYTLSSKLSSDSSINAKTICYAMTGSSSLNHIGDVIERKMRPIATFPLTTGSTLYLEVKPDNSAYKPFYYLQLARKEIPVPELKSLAGKRRALAASWSKTSRHANGYQIRWSTSKSMRNARKKLVSGTKRTSAKLTGLKAKKRYYVQTRAYYVDYDRETYWHKQYHFFTWSKAKSAKTK